MLEAFAGEDSLGPVRKGGLSLLAEEAVDLAHLLVVAFVRIHVPVKPSLGHHSPALDALGAILRQLDANKVNDSKQDAPVERLPLPPVDVLVGPHEAEAANDVNLLSGLHVLISCFLCYL